jgi:dihydrofolate synthase/folylpolyglutamate synthase
LAAAGFCFPRNLRNLRMMSFADAFAYLLSLGHETLTIKLGLENTERLLSALDNPHKSFPSVQIAGTNGKGSTAVMLESICRASGIRVGLFTSPHLISITERIRIDGEEISETEFAHLTGQVKGTAEELVARGELQTLPTFFEHVTAIALLAFREAKVELAILESGLGGRLDSTTAAGAQIVAITPIAMDHEEYLGHSLREIAAEKAAIIRTGVTAVVARQEPDARNVIARRCTEIGVTPRFVSVPAENFRNVSLSLRGKHQTTNAATAIALAEALIEHGFLVSHETIVSGLETAKHPGRLELWDSQPPILFDGAHNPAAARALREYLNEVREPITMIFGAMRDKDLHAIAEILYPIAREIVVTQVDNPRSATIEELTAAAPVGFDGEKIRAATSVTEALRKARSLVDDNSLILVTGSLYLVGAVQQHLRTEN